MKKLLDPFLVGMIFNKEALTEVERAIKEAEYSTSGEIRFAVEGMLPLLSAFQGVTPRKRAEELFSEYRMWDTEENTGVLIYLLLSRRCFEIVADRGISKKITQQTWQDIAKKMSEDFGKRRYLDGVLSAIHAVGHELKGHFPSTSDIEGNEIENRPKIV